MLARKVLCTISAVIIFTLFYNEPVDSTILTLNGSIIQLFTNPTNVYSRFDAASNCISWGGNLATINSWEEDAQLYSLTNDTHFQCWIGLEKKFVNRDSKGYSWIDGNDNLYRKYDNNSALFSKRYMKFRPNGMRSLTRGWIDAELNENSNCYFCRKLANPKGCDFVDDGFCYRVYQEITNTFNWDDAQSGCVNWGGNLVSITSPQENGIMNKRRPLTAENCWIGMYMQVNGSTYWNDGTIFNYTNWYPGFPKHSGICLRWNQYRQSRWYDENCATLQKCYICKKVQSPTFSQDLKREFRYGDLLIAYVTTSPFGILRDTAQEQCIGWGGSLITITSATVDQILYNTAVSNDLQCWIGLEIETRGNDDIIWVDGSNSTYRNYSRMTTNNDAIAKYYAFRNKNGSISDGWISMNRLETLSCYFCGKLANSRGCQLVNNGSCYRTFETNNVITWDSANVNCIHWGGTLASITSETENDFLYERTPYSANNCWIGKYNRNEDGNYSWNNGDALNFINWGTMDQSTGNCVVHKVGGNNAWTNSICSIGKKCYTCKRTHPPLPIRRLEDEITYRGFIYSYYTFNRAGQFRGTSLHFSCIFTGGSLATIDSVELDQMLYDLAASSNDTECWIGLEKATRGNETTIWEDGSVNTYRKIQGQTSVKDEIIQYYSLRAKNGNRTDGWNGVNRRQTLSCAICQRPVNIRDCQFTYNGSCYRTFQLVYPTINWYEAQSKCVMWGGNLASITSEDENTLLYLRTPYSADNCWIGLTNSSNKESGDYYWIDGAVSNFNKWISREPNTEINADGCARNKISGGKGWDKYNCSNTTDSYICKRDNTSRFDPDLGDLFGELINGIGYKELKSNTILYRNPTLICGDAINPTTSSITWMHSRTNDLSETIIVSAENFHSQPGITYITVNKAKQGFYHCNIQRQSGNNSVYTIGILNISITVSSFGDPISYTFGSPTLLYYTTASIPDSQIRWTTETVMEGDTHTFNPEYTNPVALSTVFSDVGAGRITLTCFYRNSPAMVLGRTELYMKDIENVTISYLNHQITFSDVTNPSFPNSQTVRVPSNTDIRLGCSLSLCSWKINYNDDTTKTTIPSFQYSIMLFEKDDEGTYSLIRTTVYGKEYTTASVNIKIKPITQSSYILYIATAGSVLLCLTAILSTSTVCIVFIIIRKKRKSNAFSPKQFTNEASNSPSQHIKTQHHDTQANSPRKREYENLNEEIDETTFLESAEATNYQNIYTTNREDYENHERVAENNMMRPIPLDTYKTYINGIWNSEGSLEIEYESLGGNVHRYNCTIATMEHNRVKNRFKLIFPYDASRVILKATSEGPPSDYINASYIPGLYVEECFIAAQAPKEVTIQSFWQMIIENDVSNIVMLTNLVENNRIKCEAYYPMIEGKGLAIGPYEIVLIKEDIFPGYVIRILSVKHRTFKKQIKQFHFTAWPDHDVPELYDELIQFVEKVHAYKTDPKSPILVHCSAGVGRSGTFIALYNLSAAVKQGKAISIYKLVHEMREHRPQMVQTFTQYKFIYLSVLEMLLGSTAIPNSEFTNTYKLYMQSENEGYVSVFFEQFSELNYQCEKGIMHVCTSALEEINKDKNPIESVLPSDKNRLILYSRHLEGDYINATSIDDNQYIITITPTKHTSQDFFQLIYQYEASLVVFLATPKELTLIQEGRSDRIVYWPNKGEPFNSNAFTLTLKSSKKISSMVRNKITLRHNFENEARKFTQIISTKWNEKGEPDLAEIAIVLNAILKHKQANPGFPIIFHCSDGAGKTGVLLTVLKAILESKEKNLIDIFHIIKKLRNERMNFVSTLEHYVSCFSLLNEYCSNDV